MAEGSTFGDRMSDQFEYHWNREGEPANEATRRLRREHPDHYYTIRPALQITLGDGRLEQIYRDAALGIPAKGYTADELIYRRRADEGVARIRAKAGIVDFPNDPGAPERGDSRGGAAEYDQFQYHWTTEGEPANEATRRLRDEDAERYLARRPALNLKIDGARIDRIMRDVGLGIPAKDYTKDELLFRARIEEETALIRKKGQILDWKPDLEVPGQ